MRRISTLQFEKVAGRVGALLGRDCHASAVAVSRELKGL
jgi:hypothetical protein